MSKFEIAQLVVWFAGALFQGVCFGFFFGRLAGTVKGLDSRVARIEKTLDLEATQLLTHAHSAGR
jgi:hypothetical protein